MKMKLMNRLIDRRHKVGMSQLDVAKVLKCTQSRISKLEDSQDTYIRIGDLRAYAKAVGLKVKINIR